MKKFMKKILFPLLAFCFLFLINETSAEAAKFDDHEDYELGETYTGFVGRSTDYYEFTLTEKSHVSFDIKSSGTTCFNLALYKADGTVAVKSSAFIFTYDSLNENYYSRFYRVLPAGTYYFMAQSTSSNARITYTFNIQAQGQIKMPKGKFNSLTSPQKGQMKVVCTKATNAIGYRIMYSTDERMKKNVKTVYSPTATKTIKNLTKGKRYYVKVCPYTVYDDGEYAYGANSFVKSILVKKK